MSIFLTVLPAAAAPPRGQVAAAVTLNLKRWCHFSRFETCVKLCKLAEVGMVVGAVAWSGLQLSAAVESQTQIHTFRWTSYSLTDERTSLGYFKVVS